MDAALSFMSRTTIIVNKTTFPLEIKCSSTGITAYVPPREYIHFPAKKFNTHCRTASKPSSIRFRCNGSIVRLTPEDFTHNIKIIVQLNGENKPEVTKVEDTQHVVCRIKVVHIVWEYFTEDLKKDLADGLGFTLEETTLEVIPSNDLRELEKANAGLREVLWKKEQQIATLTGERDTLASKVTTLESENTNLKNMLEMSKKYDALEQKHMKLEEDLKLVILRLNSSESVTIAHLQGR